jgi:hypothetical protein
MTLYYMDRLPQILQYNPALMPQMKFFVELPGLGGPQIEINNSGFNLGQFLDFSDHVAEATYNPDQFIRSIGDQNKTTFEARSNIFSFGFRLKQNQFLAVGMSVRGVIDITAPSKVVYLTQDFQKIADRMPLSVNAITARMNTFSQLSATYSRAIGDGLTVGISPKLIGAMGSVRSERLNFEVSQTGTDEFDQKFDGEVQLGLPVPINPSAVGRNGELDTNTDILEPGWDKKISGSTLFENLSLAVDLGVNYQLDQNWSFSGSILDIGRSSWKKYGYDISYNGETATVKDLNKLTMKIPAKIFLGADYRLTPRWNAGFLFRDVMYESGSYTSATLSMNGDVGRMLSASVSYTAGHTFDNLGLGLRLRFFPGADLYVVTDNFLQAFSYRKIQYAAAAFGINISIGVKHPVTTAEAGEKL